MTVNKPVLFSGIQPSGNLTLGNYIGALKNWVSLQDKYDSFFSIVDLHTITIRHDINQFDSNCYDALATYLAAGIDPKTQHIFLQSQVSEHTQLAWILNCYTYIGELNRMTQFKDKSKKHAENINVGLFDYPVLMAADILLYQTSLVPVGADQKQHLELARDLAIRFNNLYGDVFTVPEVYHPPFGARIMSLQNPMSKMSKSDSDQNAVIFLSDSPDQIVKKLKRAVTDSATEITYDIVKKPGVSNLLTILSVVSDRSAEEWAQELQGQGYGKLKTTLAENLIEFLNPFQEEFQKLRNDQAYLDQILKQGREYSQECAQQTLQKVYDVLGFISKN